MTIRTTAVNVHTHPGNVHGHITLRDDLTNRDVRLRVHPTEKLPGYVIDAEPGQDIYSDWPVFVVEADLIIRTLLLTAEEAARRDAVVRGVITSNRLEGFDDDRSSCGASPEESWTLTSSKQPWKPSTTPTAFFRNQTGHRKALPREETFQTHARTGRQRRMTPIQAYRSSGSGR